MYHVNKRSSMRNKKFCFICFSIFMCASLTGMSYFNKNKDTEEQTKHENGVQSNIQSVETEDLIPIIDESPFLYAGGIELVFQNIKIEESQEKRDEQQEETKQLERENTLYYIMDNNCRYDFPEEYQDYLWGLCKKYNVEDYYELFIAQIYHESSFDESVISSTNDYGLMQINKCNHSWLSKELDNNNFLDPYNNMEAGVLMMSEYLQKYSDVHKALVCYNKGESAVTNGIYSSSYSKCVIEDMSKLVEIK